MKAIFLKYYAFLPLVALCLFYVWKAVSFPAHDFANYYFGGKLLASGHLDYRVYLPYEFNTAIADLGFANIFASYAPNSPLVAVVFLPFSFLPLALAKLVFNVLGVAAFLFSLRRLMVYYKIDSCYLFWIPILFFVPLKNDLLFGQLYLFLFFLLAECWLAYEKKQWKSMALFLALAIFLKVFPILLVLVLLYRKAYSALFYLLIYCCVLLLLGILFSGTDIWSFYFTTVLVKASAGEISEAYVTNYQSVFMFLKQWLVFDKTLNREALFNAPVWFDALLLAFKIKILVIGYFFTRRANDSLFVVSFWLVAMVLLSPYGSTYTFLLLVLPFFYWVKSTKAWGKKIAAWVLLFIICNVPLALVANNGFPFSYFRLWALLLFFGLLLSQMWRCIDIKTLCAATVIPVLLVLLLKKESSPDSSTLLLAKGPMLIYDYTIVDNRLTYFYWDEKGENAASIPFPADRISHCEIIQNQIYYQGKQLTNDAHFKRKPLTVDNKYVVFLTDANRGIGFYTLQKMALY